ncbi:MAG: hypothetical protein Q4B67_09275 [Eubacteriales bacterium]|nr:hypothetical protein [Eubacteriales bacterium]
MDQVYTDEECMSVLSKTNPENAAEYIGKYASDIFSFDNPFAAYMYSMKDKKKFVWTDVFNKADISGSYGFKLIDGYKRTNKRDTILRLCLGLELDYQETCRVLSTVDMARLRPVHPRDAVIISAILKHIYDIDKINELLILNNQKPLG